MPWRPLVAALKKFLDFTEQEEGKKEAVLGAPRYLIMHRLSEPSSQTLGRSTTAPGPQKWKLRLKVLKTTQLVRDGAGT